MKSAKIIFWISTIIIFLFEGVMPALTSHTQLAREAIRLLGYPAYFPTLLAVFKVAGAVVLMLPQFSNRIKEWAYAGFTFNFLSAAISNGVVYGFGFEMMLPLVVLLIMAVSYVYYHKLNQQATATFSTSHD